MSSAAKNVQPEPVPGTSYNFDDLMHPSVESHADLPTRIGWGLKDRVATMLETQRGRNQLLIASAALGFGVGILLRVWRSHA